MLRLGRGPALALLAALLAVSAVFAGSPAYAQDAVLSAEVDRPTIRANESFTYILRAEGRLSGEPDLSALERDFDIAERRSSQSIRIVNGRQSQVSEWIYQLLPRQAGTFEIPAVEIGGVYSNPVTLEVLPAPSAGDASADLFIEVELDRSAGYVQAQVVYTLKLYVGIGMGRATLTPPAIQGGEAIIEKLGDDREYQTDRGNRNYYVRERRFAIFPQQAGTLTVGPATFEAMVIPNGGFSRRQRLRSDVLELEVKPAVAPPASNPDAAWLPAADLRIEQAWSDTEETFTEGVPRTRTLTVVADGLLETQLPELRIATADGLRQYPDQPDLSREVSADGIIARRVERLAVVAQREGEIELPPIELPWFDVDAERWEIARLDASTVTATGGPDPTPRAQLELQSERPADEAAPGPSTWLWISAGLALGWVATVAAWILRTRVRPPRVPAQTAEQANSVQPPSGRGLIRQIKAACRVDDAERTRDLLLQWARLQFSEAPPATLGALADRLKDPLAAEIRALEASLYGRTRGTWSGRNLAEQIQSTQTVNRAGGDDEDQDPLVPLYR